MKLCFLSFFFLLLLLVCSWQTGELRLQGGEAFRVHIVRGYASREHVTALQARARQRQIQTQVALHTEEAREKRKHKKKKENRERKI